MAGVVASNVRNIRAKSLSLRDSKEEAETVRKLQIRQEQIEYNNRWKQKLNSHSKNNSSSSVVLYLGLGVSSIGLIIFLVGVGDKGFKSVELQLIGPCLIGLGLLMAIFQIVYCTKPWKKLKCCSKDENGKQATITAVKPEMANKISKPNNHPAVINIKSCNEGVQAQQTLETISEMSRSNSSKRQSSQDISGSLRNLKEATIILNSSKFSLD